MSNQYSNSISNDNTKDHYQSILKKDSTLNLSNKNNKKIVFNNPIQKTYSIESWKKYNGDPNGDSACFCIIF